MDYSQYDSAIGRFYSIDRLSEASRDIAPYRFAYNNRVYFSDPSGLLEQTNNGSNDLTGWVNQGGKTFGILK